MLMISVIVCSIQEPSWTLHERNVGRTIGVAHEYLRVDNRRKQSGICAAYNSGVAQSKGDILVFVHEDAFFMLPGWGQALEQKFAADPALGLVGVAGTQYLGSESMSWGCAGQPYIKGRVVHELEGGREFFMSVFSLNKSDAEVVAVDGLFFAVRRTLFDRIRFDEALFDAYHFYDLDLCMQVRRTHRLIVTWDILLQHRSAGNANDLWRTYGRRFLDKYKNELPATCAPVVPDFTKELQPGIKYDLRGKMSPDIIC
jgi:Glycosyltransferase like family